MANKFADRVLETTSTTGTGTLNLDGAATGFRTFVAGIGTGNSAAYVITDGVDWETGVGVVTDSSPDTLSRVTVNASSNGGAKVNWTNGVASTRDVFVAPLADEIGFDSGTVMLFHQSAAPAGWTKDTAATLDDSALRVLTNTSWVSGQGGATVFSSVFGSSKVTGQTTISIAQMPAHTHDITVGDTTVGNVRDNGAQNTSTLSNAALTRGGGNFHTHTESLDLNYINMIIASKD